MLILASQSPRRSELLQMAGFDFRCIPSNAEENIENAADTAQLTMQLALQKARAVKKDRTGDVVIGSDTVVEIDGRILGKPLNRADAVSMIKMLSGRIHTVTTGVAICTDSADEVFAVCAKVEFYDLSDGEIEAYVATGEPMDKAGAYGIQGKGALLVKGIEGDFYTVMGLPVAELARRLKNYGVVPRSKPEK